MNNPSPEMRLAERLLEAKNSIGRALRLIKAVKKPYCHHVCPTVVCADVSKKGEHGALCQEMQEVEKLLESRR